MKKPIVLLTLLPLFTACSASQGRPPQALSWPPGEYALEATVSYAVGGLTQRNQYRANLLISPEGELSLSSSTRICLDPTRGQAAADRQRRQRTFRCGDVRYVLRPRARTVQGGISTSVVEDELVTECVAYGVDANGVRICVEVRERWVSRSVSKGARLRVSEMP